MKMLKSITASTLVIVASTLFAGCGGQGDLAQPELELEEAALSNHGSLSYFYRAVSVKMVGYASNGDAIIEASGSGFVPDRWVLVDLWDSFANAVTEQEWVYTNGDGIFSIYILHANCGGFLWARGYEYASDTYSAWSSADDSLPVCLR